MLLSEVHGAPSAVFEITLQTDEKKEEKQRNREDMNTVKPGGLRRSPHI